MKTTELTNTYTFRHFLGLKQPENSFILTYIWIDGFGKTTRSKCKVLNFSKEDIELKDVPIWYGYGFVKGVVGEIESYQTYVPVAMYNDPFLENKNKLILCVTFDINGKPTVLNRRGETEKFLKNIKKLEPWFGFEQEYYILNEKRPYKWPKIGFPGPMGPHYCGVGGSRSYGRALTVAHLKACLYAGLHIGGVNGECVPGQWEYQIGPLDGITVSDEMWVSRYILERIAEDFGLDVCFDPKPIPGIWSGSGGHCNFSTNEMRKAGGIEYVEKAIEKMSLKHNQDMKLYDPSKGIANEDRLTGEYFCSAMHKFTTGVEDKFASVRIPNLCNKAGCGYLEDRRPSADCDPYLVVSTIVKTVFDL
ncbi:hypothetical protein A3Q56_01964 [Intoshia linei]|uniref:glutamine synthetase n=1 Tax=Intoshia linei TaxID=1819745 RepID=A0A177B7Q1_9BILA|nr:hypothetical protein A3Q56_01964 [Intoshia linei]